MLFFYDLEKLIRRPQKEDIPKLKYMMT